MATHWTQGCDAEDPHRLAAFWAQALGYVNEPGYDEPEGKNRLHIDIRVAGEPPWDMAAREILVRAKAEELADAGGEVVREDSWDGTLSHIMMRDPEGNEFCVA